MINKVIDFLLNKIGYIIALTVGIFFKDIINKDYMKLNDIDNQRKVKIYSLYAALSNNENSTRSMKKIESILNKNIYIDEAVELYIYDKINNI